MNKKILIVICVVAIVAIAMVAFVTFRPRQQQELDLTLTRELLTEETIQETGFIESLYIPFRVKEGEKWTLTIEILEMPKIRHACNVIEYTGFWDEGIEPYICTTGQINNAIALNRLSDIRVVGKLYEEGESCCGDNRSRRIHLLCAFSISNI